MIFSGAVEITVMAPTTTTTSITTTPTTTTTEEESYVTFEEEGLPTNEIFDRRPGRSVEWSVESGGQTYYGLAGQPIKVPARMLIAVQVSRYAHQTLTYPQKISFNVPAVKVFVNTRTLTYTASPSSGTAQAGQTVKVSFSTQ